MKVFTEIKSIHGIQGNLSKPLKGKSMSEFKSIENAFLVINDGRIIDFGEMTNFPDKYANCKSFINCSGKIILPTYKEDEVIVARERVSDFKTWIG